MLETYFSAPKTLRRLHSGISGPHIDAFADDLERERYAPSSSVRYIRAASHLGCFGVSGWICYTEDRATSSSPLFELYLACVLDQQPDFRTENAVQSSANVVIERSCFVSRPVYSSM
jgi:hypothetical protein